MLFAVEGGGFFSASASGYSKLLSLLLFGQKNEERPMRVSPWNQLPPTERELDSTTQLDPRSDAGSRGCPIPICFCLVSTGHDGNSPPKVGPILPSDSRSGTSYITKKRKDSITCNSGIGNNGSTLLKSSIKKNPLKNLVMSRMGDAQEKPDEMETIVTKKSSDRKVKWSDACGRELVEIREFEPSKEGPSDEDSERCSFQKCECVIQ